jgi:hypothetical protein
LEIDINNYEFMFTIEAAGYIVDELNQELADKFSKKIGLERS